MNLYMLNRGHHVHGVQQLLARLAFGNRKDIDRAVDVFRECCTELAA